MKRKIVKTLTIILIIMLLLQVNSFAELRPSQINGNTTIAGEGEITTVAGRILGVIDWGGTVLAIVAITIIGIQYMKASLEQKAQYKEKLIPYAIGCLLLFAAPKIAKLVYNIATKI